jgi:signal transduction histidine kinase/DNA-binding response OmpR family regulator
MTNKMKSLATAAVIGCIVIALILVLGTIWMGKSAKEGTETAVHSVSTLYLDELSGRRVQVVENNLQKNIEVIRVAVSLMTEEDLSDAVHLQAYQARMKRLFRLEKFAFVDRNGTIYTSLGTQTNINDYDFDYAALAQPEIFVLNPESTDKKAVIAVPIEPLTFNGEKLIVCFMEISMDELLSGVSVKAQNTGTTFCNIYTRDGFALSNMVLGGLAAEDNLLEALKRAIFDEGYSYEQVVADFAEGNDREVTFTYDGIRETISYDSISGTDWMLTYLIRESVISDKISSVSEGIVKRNAIQSVLTITVLLVLFGFVFAQSRKNARLMLDSETAQAEIRGKQEELEQRIALQEKLEEQSQALSDALAAAEDANRAKTAFLSNMSHEIRTPMNAIIGLDNIALNDQTISDTTRDYLEKIGASAEHLLHLINDILDMSRIESGRMTFKNEEFSFSELLKAVNTMFSSQCNDKGLDYTCHIHGEVDDYYIGDNMKLRQVLINILGNAVKFTPEGGKVSLIVKRMAQLNGLTTLCFRIADTGIGMSKEYLPRIFDTFSQEDSSTTNKYGSSGLGMAITKNIVEMMNGEIEVESEKGKGTVFTVMVTLMDSERKNAEGDVTVIHPGEMTVLIVDDDPIACEHAKLVLEKAGISAEIAGSGLEAVEMVSLRQTRMEPYNLILVDWKMPEMDGVETTRRIREIVGNESAIIILTAYRWDDVLEEAVQAGVDSFIAKPVFATAVMEEFESAMMRKGIKAKKDAKKADLTGRRVLLAEDVQVNAEIMIMLLQMRQMEADLAVNGKIAVEKFSEHEQGYYDAILMDMRMPEMDGLEATQAIRAMDRPDAKSIPIIALTANAFDEDVQRSMQAGLNAHLSKPVQPDTLYETLENLIPAK